MIDTRRDRIKGTLFYPVFYHLFNRISNGTLNDKNKFSIQEYFLIIFKQK
jgi:hypothetical protein